MKQKIPFRSVCVCVSVCVLPLCYTESHINKYVTMIILLLLKQASKTENVHEA